MLVRHVSYNRITRWVVRCERPLAHPRTYRVVLCVAELNYYVL